ncbi:MAG: hypothetical protein AB1Z98_36995 [Nannocystaceae bacterium]
MARAPERARPRPSSDVVGTTRVVAVHEVGRSDGEVFVAMEFIFGTVEVRNPGSQFSQVQSDERLGPGDSLVSCNGKYELTAAASGELVLYKRGSVVLWEQKTKPGGNLLMQKDGNLVSYAPGSGAVWSTGTHGNGNGCRLTLHDNGSLVLRRSDGTPIWNRSQGKL